MRPQAAWKVRIQIARAVRPSIRSRRSRISPAALLVNVMARISLGLTPQARMRWATRWVSTLVFPEPAPAMTSSGPSVCSTASRWASFSPARWSFGSTGACTEDIHRCYPPSGSGLPARPAFMDDRGRRENVGEPWVPPRQTLSSAAVIREASVDDVAGAAALFGLITPRFVRTAASLRHNMLTDPPEAKRCWWCAESDGTIVGWASLGLVVEATEEGVAWMGV